MQATSIQKRRGLLAHLENRNTLILVLAFTLCLAYVALFYAKARHSPHGAILFAVGNTILRMALDMCVVAFAFSFYLSGEVSGRAMFPGDGRIFVRGPDPDDLRRMRYRCSASTSFLLGSSSWPPFCTSPSSQRGAFSFSS